MPLLRKKPFVPEKPPPSLKADDEVFYCEYTGEIFVDYETFYQRMILCNSLVWSCECTGKPNLTFKEAKDSEESVKKSLAAFPEPLKRSVLSLVHHTKRSKISDLTDEIYDYLKVRYQLNEDIELKMKDKWLSGKIIVLPDKTNVNLIQSPQKSPQKSLKSPTKDKENDSNAANKTVSKSPLGNKSHWPDPLTAEYKVSLTKGAEGDVVSVKGKNLRRTRGVFQKEKVRLYIRQTCARTTTSSDEGYWVVNPPAISTFNLGPSTIMVEDSGKSIKRQSKLTSKSVKKKEKPSKSKSPTKKPSKEKEKLKKSKSEAKPMTLEEKRKKYLKEKEKEKEMKLLEIEMAKMKKLREKEEEKARKKDEREKEKELANEVKKLEIDFLKEFSKAKEDLRLEDLKPLPTLCPMKSDLDQDLIGDAMMIVEFIHIFGELFEVDENFEGKVTLDWIQEALTEHDAEGKYYQVLHFFLHSYLKFEQEENIHANDEEEEISSDSEEEKDSPTVEEEENNENNLPKKPSSNARAAAAWPMLHQGLALHEITIEPFSLTEALRLHILSSGAKLGTAKNYNEWQHRGQYQFSDDPCVSFRHTEVEIMKKLAVSSVYDLTASEKLKILVLMCNQMLMLNLIRDHMEDTNDKLKTLRKQLREIQHEENQRRKAISKEKWKKTLAERKKKQEEVEKRKQEKKAQAEAERGDKDGKNKEKPIDDTQKETPEELQEKKRRKEAKEAKEMQVEEFHREKFLFKERELMKEISKCAAVINESPFGRDRRFRRYWSLSAIDGIIVENDDDGAAILLDLNRHESEDVDFESEEEMDGDEDSKQDSVQTSPGQLSTKRNLPKVTLEEIMKAKDEGEPLEELLLTRYKCQYSSKTNELIERSNIIQSQINNVKNSVDPAIYSATDQTKWASINSKEQFLAILDSLNNRGVREQALLSNFNNEKAQIVNQYLQTEKEQERLANKRQVKPAQKKVDQAIDKSLFKCMEDFIEASLRDSILELEERIWIAGFGSVTVNREGWRRKIEEGMTKLIQVDVDDTKDEVKATKEVLVNGVSSTEKGVLNGHHEKNEVTESFMEVDGEVSKPIKAIPLHIKNGIESDKEQSRCSTPVDEFSENDRNELVKELADALLKVEHCIEKKYVKPPLGESAETKKERLKEQIVSGGKADVSTSKEEEKKPSTSLKRWEESLSKCSSFSQVFVHLNTLDRSICWDKSIQNVKCRLCRRKGNEDEMLLCDGCDRGFHMSCLKPPLKNVPQGDWYCRDCKPVEVKRRSRKPSRVVEETEEEETEEEDTEEEEDESDEEESDEEESEYDNEEEEEESGSEHGESCTVCDGEGTLILCESCPRSFHVECCYPSLRKVPRGSWICQICKGTDTELPYRKRAATIEKKRVKEKKEEMKPKKIPINRKQRGMPAPTTSGKRSNPSNDSSRPKKRARLDDDDSQSSQKSTCSVGRQQLKQCTILLNEITKREEAEAFLAPVDPKEVPDYLEFVDIPMDFGTIKQKLNTAKYLEVQDFLDDIQQVFSNCETYNPPRSQVGRDGNKLKTFVKKKIKELKLV